MTTINRVQLAKIAQRIPGQYVEQVDVGGGRKEPYIPHEVVNQFLLYILGPFDFEIVELVRGDLPAIPPNPNGSSRRAKDGTPALTGVVVGALCRLTVDIDGRRTVITETGDVGDPHNRSNDGERAKDAASDGLKRCAMRFGFGLELRAGEHYVLDKWLPLTKKSAGSAAEQEASPAVPAAATQPAAQPRQDAPAPAEAEPPVREPAPAASPPPEAAAGATPTPSGPDAAGDMEALCKALHIPMNRAWLRLRKAGQDGQLPEHYAKLADARAVRNLQDAQFEVAKQWLTEHFTAAQSGGEAA